MQHQILNQTHLYYNMSKMCGFDNTICAFGTQPSRDAELPAAWDVHGCAPGFVSLRPCRSSRCLPLLVGVDWTGGGGVCSSLPPVCCFISNSFSLRRSASAAAARAFSASTRALASKILCSSLWTNDTADLRPGQFQPMSTNKTPLNQCSFRMARLDIHVAASGVHLKDIVLLAACLGWMERCCFRQSG